jgi:putative membrane protein
VRAAIFATLTEKERAREAVMDMPPVQRKQLLQQGKEAISRMRVPQLKTPVAKAAYVAAVTTIFTFLGCWVVLAHQDNAPTQRARAAGDEKFAIKAAQGGLAEVKLGQLAQEKAEMEAVRKFGQRMVDDHTQGNHELKEAAMKEKISLPTDIDRKDQATYDSLAKLSGAAFDKAYAQEMVKDHQDDIAEFGTEARTGQRDAIKTFAAETLPTLKDHLKQAKQMRLSLLKPAATSNSATPKKGSARQSAKK